MSQVASTKPAPSSKPAQQASPATTAPKPKKQREFVPHLKPFMPQIIKQIIKPEIDKVVLKAGGQIASSADFLAKFQKETGSTVNAKVFGEWLAACGYTVKKSVSLSGFTPPPTT